MGLVDALLRLRGACSARAIAGWATPTLILGWTHGVLWIVMSLACIAAVRLRVIPLRAGVAVAVLGGIGPFFGSYEFVREQRRRASRFLTMVTTGDQRSTARARVKTTWRRTPRVSRQ